MTLQQLTYFLAAADHGSFWAAAQSLHMAQPSLSEQIRRLEAELGVALFARVGRGLELTEAGRLLRPQAERTLAAAREAAESVREVRDAHRRHGAFGTFGSAHHYLLAGLVQEFRKPPPQRAGARGRPELLRGRRGGPRGRLEAGPDRAPDRRPRASTCGRRSSAELLYLSRRRRARAAEPMTIERLVDAAADPLRRALRAGATRCVASCSSAPSAPD